MGDLMDECATSIEGIKAGLEQKNFSLVQKAAHTIKGSASYLCCEVLKDIALVLQDLGTVGLKGDNTDEIWKQIAAAFVTFEKAVDDVKTAISA